MKINCKYYFCFIWDIFLEGNFTYADVIKGGKSVIHWETAKHYKKVIT